MTYTALATLKTLGDDLSRINRAGIIQGCSLMLEILLNMLYNCHITVFFVHDQLCACTKLLMGAFKQRSRDLKRAICASYIARVLFLACLMIGRVSAPNVQWITF